MIVTHFEPPAVLLAKSRARLWIYDHHHGHFDGTIAGRRLVRNALGYPGEPVDTEPARQDYVVEVEP